MLLASSHMEGIPPAYFSSLTNTQKLLCFSVSPVHPLLTCFPCYSLGSGPHTLIRIPEIASKGPPQAGVSLLTSNPPSTLLLSKYKHDEVKTCPSYTYIRSMSQRLVELLNEGTSRIVNPVQRKIQETI